MIGWLLGRPLILAALTALLTAAVSFPLGELSGARQERLESDLRNANAENNQLKERGKIDEDVNNDDIADICIELGGRLPECRGQ